MQTKITSFVGVILFALILSSFSTQPALAQNDQFTGQGDGGAGSIIPVGGGGGIENPLGGGKNQTITDVLTGVIKWMLGLVGFLALIAIIIGGGRMIMDFGNEDQVKKGKATILWAVIGLAIVILSYAIINIVTSDILGAGSQKAYDTAPAGPGGDPFKLQ